MAPDWVQMVYCWTETHSFSYGLKEAVQQLNPEPARNHKPTLSSAQQGKKPLVRENQGVEFQGIIIKGGVGQV
ncbi:MAG: hypothetical protein L3J22_02475 [Xanthomonadales bacterium]|nr:hypothetical protein [Xanthomonadales bacterium]